MIGGTIDRKASDRGLTLALWKDVQAIADKDPRRGVFEICDFQKVINVDSNAAVLADGWGFVATAVNGGTCAQYATSDNRGEIEIAAGANTAGDGVNIQGGPWVTPKAGRTIVWEARLKQKTITTGPLFFMGLADSCTAAITGGGTAVVNTTNVVDAVAVTTVVSNGGGTALYTYHDETGESAVQSSTAIHTFVDDAYVKIGGRIIGAATTGKVEWWINGEEQTSFLYEAISGTRSIPAVPMIFTLCHQADGTQPLCYVDWVAVGAYD